MPAPEFIIRIQGPQAAEAAAELSQVIEEEFGQAPARRTETAVPPDPENPHRAIDPLAVDLVKTVLLSLPVALMAYMDLADRIEKRRKAGRVVDAASGRAGVEATVTLPDGTTIAFRDVDPNRLIDAARESAGK